MTGVDSVEEVPALGVNFGESRDEWIGDGGNKFLEILLPNLIRRVWFGVQLMYTLDAAEELIL